MIYANLKAEMARANITIAEICKITSKSRSAVSKNLNGSGSFTVDEGIAIRNKFFPNLSIDYLFSKR